MPKFVFMEHSGYAHGRMVCEVEADTAKDAFLYIVEWQDNLAKLKRQRAKEEYLKAYVVILKDGYMDFQGAMYGFYESRHGYSPPCFEGTTVSDVEKEIEARRIRAMQEVASETAPER